MRHRLGFGLVLTVPVLAAGALFADDANVEELSGPAYLHEALAVEGGEYGWPGSPTAPKFVLYYSSLCGHCHHFAPIYREFARRNVCGGGAGRGEFLAFECTGSMERRKECRKHSEVTGFPSLVAYNLIMPPSVQETAEDGEAEKIGRGKVVGKAYKGRTYGPEEVEIWLLSKGAILGDCADKQSESANHKLETPEHYQQQAVADDDIQNKEDEYDKARSLECHGAEHTDATLHDAIVGIHTLMRDWQSVARPMQEGILEARLLLSAAASILPGQKIQRELREAAEELKKMLVANFDDSTDGNVGIAGIADFLENLSFGGISAKSTPILCDSQQCPVWILFHTLAAGESARIADSEVKGTLQRPVEVFYSAKKSTMTRLAEGFLPLPAELMAIILASVQSFMSCNMCRHHFKKAYENCSFGRCDLVPDVHDMRSASAGSGIMGAAEGLVQWLWRTHNGTTVRKAAWHAYEGRPGSEKEVDVRFPPEEKCPKCRIPRASPLLVSKPLEIILSNRPLTDDDVDKFEDFDLKEMHQFLMNFYWNELWTTDPHLEWNGSQSCFLMELPTKGRLGEVELSGVGGSAHGTLWGFGLISAVFASTFLISRGKGWLMSHRDE